jgi:hypothetical protein
VLWVAAIQGAIRHVEDEQTSKDYRLTSPIILFLLARVDGENIATDGRIDDVGDNGVFNLDHFLCSPDGNPHGLLAVDELEVDSGKPSDALGRMTDNVSSFIARRFAAFVQDHRKLLHSMTCNHLWRLWRLWRQYINKPSAPQ